MIHVVAAASTTRPVVCRYKCGPDNTAVCNTVFETAQGLTPAEVTAELNAQIAADPSLDPGGDLQGVTVEDILKVEEIPQDQFTDTDSPISAATCAEIEVASRRRRGYKEDGSPAKIRKSKTVASSPQLPSGWLAS